MVKSYQPKGESDDCFKGEGVKRKKFKVKERPCVDLKVSKASHPKNVPTGDGVAKGCRRLDKGRQAADGASL